MTRQEQQRLGKTLWAIADRLRGAMNADDFRDYMLAFLFLRYLSSNYEAAARSGKLYTYHFTILRSIMEKTATFHGFSHFGDVMKRDPDDEDGTLHFRYVQLLSHGSYSLFEPVEMIEENKEIFRKILTNFMNDYRFNPELFPVAEAEENAA